jgi:hypothetical protein
MNEIKEIKFKNNYKIWIKFKNGFSKEIDFSPFIGKGISRELKNPDYFKKAEIESGGGLQWPNGYDFCPNYLRPYAEKI